MKDDIWSSKKCLPETSFVPDPRPCSGNTECVEDRDGLCSLGADFPGGCSLSWHGCHFSPVFLKNLNDVSDTIKLGRLPRTSSQHEVTAGGRQGHGNIWNTTLVSTPWQSFLPC